MWHSVFLGQKAVGVCFSTLQLSFGNLIFILSYGLQLSRAFYYYSRITLDTGSLFPRQLQVYCVKRFHFQSDMAHCYKKNVGFPGGLVVKNLPANIRDMGSIPDPRRFHMPQSNKPVHHNYEACALKPRSHSYWAHGPHLLKPTCSKAHAPQQEEPPRWETCVSQLEWSLLSATREKPTRQPRPSTAINKEIIL